MGRGFKGTSMQRCRLAPFLTIAAVMIGMGWPQHGLAQTKVPTQSIDPFGQEVKLALKRTHRALGRMQRQAAPVSDGLAERMLAAAG